MRPPACYLINTHTYAHSHTHTHTHTHTHRGLWHAASNNDKVAQRTCHVVVGDYKSTSLKLQNIWRCKTTIIILLMIINKNKCAGWWHRRLVAGLGELTPPDTSRHAKPIGFPYFLPRPRMKEESPLRSECAAHGAQRFATKRETIQATPRSGRAGGAPSIRGRMANAESRTRPPRLPPEILTIPSFSAACTAILSRIA